MEVSFVIPSHNEGENLRKTVQSLQQATESLYEVIVVDNGSTDESSDFIGREPRDSRLRLIRTQERLGVSGARNLGAAQATGEALVFLDAHVLFPAGWMSPILQVLKRENTAIVAPGVSAWGNPGSKGFGMRWRNARLDVEWLSQRSSQPYPVPMVPGLCMAFRRDFFQEIGQFDPGMVNYGSEDLEICLRSWLCGYEVLIVPLVEVSHLFRPRHPYQVAWREVLYNLLRTVYAHFNPERAGRVLAAIRSFPGFREALDQVNSSNIWDRKRELEERRCNDDNWFFTKFGLKF